jgi:hypothetical protein
MSFLVGTLMALSVTGPTPVGEAPHRPAVNQQFTLADAQALFYNRQYESAERMAFALRSAERPDLANYELRTSALLFLLKDMLSGNVSKKKAFVACLECPLLVAAFLDDLHRGQRLARARLQTDPDDDTARFFLSKLDLNYTWLQSGVLGRRKGWDEYWEARTSLDIVLRRNPLNVRARVARAWIDYIVDTELPRGTRWLFGGGSKEQALIGLRQAVAIDAELFVHAEAGFALWELLVRERKSQEALTIARDLARDFPDNPALTQFLNARR